MIQYKFGKSYYIASHGNAYSELELIVVHANSMYGRYAYSYAQSRGQARDYKNIQNTLADAEKYIADRVAKVSFRADEKPEDANKKIKKFIDENNQYRAFDASIASDIDANEDFYLRMKNAEYYHQALLALSKFEPAGVRAILTGEKYPFSAVAHDFARGVSHKQIKQDIAKLPRPVVNRMREFASQRNWVISYDAANTEGRDYKDMILRARPKIDHSDARVDNVIARAVDDMLRDALEYKYYKKTGNMGIFISETGQKSADGLSDSDFIQVVGWNAMQNYGNALQVIRRMERIIAAKRDITPFMTELNKTLGDGYANQEIIRMMYDTLAPHYNKFKNNKKVTEFVRRLHGLVKDGRQARHMAETFGLPDAPKPQKDKVRAELAVAAARIASGDNVSGVVVLDNELKMARDFAVIPTPETFSKIKKSIKPTATQMKILEKYGAHQK
ncbi:MAG: hypothetical protein J6Q44_02790 [Alphaproteobacteria bacterium]|nr:hypothetical protein [Alphaproteobacteria bacterium]